jgi:signal transduction histidine kinase
MIPGQSPGPPALICAVRPDESGEAAAAACARGAGHVSLRFPAPRINSIPKMAKAIRHWSLKSKVVLHIVILGTISAAILAVLYFTTQRNVLRSFISQESEIVGSLIENSVFLLKKCGRVQDTEAELHDLASLTEAVQSIRILTTEGRVFASTRKEEIGADVSPAERGVLAKMLTGEIPRRISSPLSRATTRSRSLILNGPACYACHDREKKINGFLEVDFDYAEASALLWKSQWKGMALALIALALLTYIVLRLFEKLINRPISGLKTAMARVQGGDFSAGWTVEKHDEIGSLGESFNKMVDDLRRANAEIESLYRQRVEKAEHLAAFGELAAGLAHEVRNPLSGIKGALEIISQDAPAGDPRREIFQEMLVQIGKLISVIQDFLNYARPKPLHFRSVPPELFVENAVRMAGTQLAGKSIDFHVRKPREDFLVSADPDRMHEVMLNLFLNSIAAIRDKGNILVIIHPDPKSGFLRILTADDGSGIPEDNLAQIFQPFFSTKKGGTGLGLSICRKTVEAHGGTLTVKSRVGKGTTFNIRIPMLHPEAGNDQ